MAECEACERPVPDVAYVCAGCADDLARRLHSVAELWPELEPVIIRQARYGEPGPRPRGRAPSAPIRPDGGALRHYADQEDGWPSGLPVELGASQVRDDVRNTVTTWARVVADERWPDGRPTRPAGPWCADECEHGSCAALWSGRQAQAAYDREMPPPAEMPTLLRWLAGQLGWCRHQRWAAEAWEELQYACRLVAVTVDAPMPRVDIGPCGAATPAGLCQHRLSGVPGAASVRCGGCGTVHDARGRRQELLVAARDIRGTAAEVARWLTALEVPTTAAVVRGLAHRGRVLDDGLGRYRLGDVEEVRVEQLARGERVTT